MQIRSAEHPRPNHFLLHISDTHLLAGGGRLYGRVASEQHLHRLFDEFEASGARPDAIVFTGDLADRGEPDAYRRLRAIVEPVADDLGAKLVWVMGNHDDRRTFRAELLDEPASDAPVDAVVDLDGLRIVTLDTTVPGHHYGAVSAEQLAWLGDVLATPAPHGTILAMHHPPMPSVLDLAASVELRDQSALAASLVGTDVRSILAGHLHYSSTASVAGIPVSVASATCYTQDLNVPVGGTPAATARGPSTSCTSTEHGRALGRPARRVRGARLDRRGRVGAAARGGRRAPGGAASAGGARLGVTVGARALRPVGPR